jgi:hypothetical protein
MSFFFFFLLLSQLTWGRRSMSSPSILLYHSSFHHSQPSLISCLTQSIHLFLGRPLPLHPSTFMFITLLVTWFSSLLITCLYQLKRFSFSFSVIGATFRLPLWCEFNDSNFVLIKFPIIMRLMTVISYWLNSISR